MNFLKRNYWMIILFVYIIFAIWPAYFWYETGITVIHDSVEGSSIELLHDGKTKIDFMGGYSVIMRNLKTNEIVCDARGGPFPYETTSKRPDPLYMEWWAPSDPRCHKPPSGDYVTTTCWKVYGLLWGLLPPKNVCTDPIHHTVFKEKG